MNIGLVGLCHSAFPDVTFLVLQTIGKLPIAVIPPLAKLHIDKVLGLDFDYPLFNYVIPFLQSGITILD